MPTALALTMTPDGPSVLFALRRGASAVRDFRPMLQDIMDLLVKQSAEAFPSEGASTAGGKWAPLSPRYKAWKDVHYPGRPILTRTGMLRHVLTAKGTAGFTGHAVRVIEETGSLAYGVRNLPYACAHQYGAFSRKLPRRPFFDPKGDFFSPNRGPLQQIVQRHLIRAVRAMQGAERRGGTSFGGIGDAPSAAISWGAHSEALGGGYAALGYK